MTQSQMDAALALLRSDVTNFETAFHAAKIATEELFRVAEDGGDDGLHAIVNVLNEAHERMASNPLTHISTPQLPASGVPDGTPGPDQPADGTQAVPAPTGDTQNIPSPDANSPVQFDQTTPKNVTVTDELKTEQETTDKGSKGK